jgi:hypothetical protein
MCFNKRAGKKHERKGFDTSMTFILFIHSLEICVKKYLIEQLFCLREKNNVKVKKGIPTREGLVILKI